MFVKVTYVFVTLYINFSDGKLQSKHCFSPRTQKKKKNVQNSHITGPVTFETKLGDSWLIGQNPNLKTHAKGEQSCK